MSLVLSLFNSPSALQGNMETLQEISCNLMEFVKKMRNNLSSLERQQDQVINKAKDALKMLDQQTQRQLDRVDKKYPLKIEQIIEPEKKEAILYNSNPDKKIVKQNQKVKLRSNVENNKPIKQTVNTASNQLLNTYIPNRKNAVPQPYSCFICLWEQKDNEQQNCHWNELQFYLQHLESKHSITPSLNILLFGCYNSLPFSHVKINGNYYHLLKNHQLQKYHCIINNEVVSNSINFAICGCSIQSNNFEQIDAIFFINNKNLFAHNRQKHDGLSYPNSTHNITNYTYRRKKQSSKLLQQNNIQEYLKKIKRIVIQYTKTHSIQDLLVQSDSLSRLEIISKMDIKWNEVFLPIGSQQQDPTRNQILDYAKIVAFDLERKVNIKGMSEEDNLLLNTQISLLKNNVFICADCQKIFKKDKREFIVHVQSCQHYSSLNSHKLCFT